MQENFQSKNPELWAYLSHQQQDLIREGQYLMTDVVKHSNYHFHDYSFVVFPFAKAYEGFLKTLFKDVKYISHLDYISDHLRLGKLLSPFLVNRLGNRSLYKQLTDAGLKELADKIWNAWKMGRNQIFHYFPHNVKSVTFEEAQEIIDNMLLTMKEAFEQLYPMKEPAAIEATKSKLKNYMNQSV